ncbi:MAG: endopeptidase La [Bacteroidales bacterium]
MTIFFMKKHNELFVLGDMMQGDAEFIPLLSSEEEENIQKEPVPEELPILPLRNMVLFPGVALPITVGRDKSIRLIKENYKAERRIGVVAQRDGNIEDPEFSDLYTTGTLAQIMRILQMPDGSTTVIIQGKQRFSIVEPLETEPYHRARVTAYTEELPSLDDQKTLALFATIKDLAIQIAQKSPNTPSEAAFALQNIESPVFLINFIASNLPVENQQKQRMLESRDLIQRAQEVLGILTRELQMLELKNEIQSKVKAELDKQQRDYILHQQIKTIQEELGDDPNRQLINELRGKAAKKQWPENVAEIFERELNKLQRMHTAAAEYSVQVNYLETLVDLPWNEFTPDNLNLERARKILNEDHYGLEKIKERLVEYLAVLKLKGDMKSPILCLVGPPGVGKTSLGKSLARGMGRKYVRMSLGGLRDEAEIRGHRKTYIGAMPGRIIQGLKKAKSANPVFVLDEIDKVSGNNINGDPEAALLEVLDPEQNNAFYDNFVEIEFDLSNVMFVATANTLATVHPALRDRLEVIELPGYLLEEKLEIARRHLIPKQLKEHGLNRRQLSFTDEAIVTIIEKYTRESGVRQLEKNIAKIIRKHAVLVAEKKKFNRQVTAEKVEELLGVQIFHKEQAIDNAVAGVVTGLAWTPAGGEIMFIEASLSRGEGKFSLTGNLGDVMKESATLALEYLKAHATELGINPEVFRKWNVHMHVPEGATPKDGPSAGVSMLTAIASAFTQRKVRSMLAMTGEITLRGKVLPVGGIREKILAAKRARYTDVILPEANRHDVKEIEPSYIEGLHLHYVDTMQQVLDIALLEEKVEKPLQLEY